MTLSLSNFASYFRLRKIVDFYPTYLIIGLKRAEECICMLASKGNPGGVCIKLEVHACVCMSRGVHSILFVVRLLFNHLT